MLLVGAAASEYSTRFDSILNTAVELLEHIPRDILLTSLPSLGHHIFESEFFAALIGYGGGSGVVTGACAIKRCSSTTAAVSCASSPPKVATGGLSHSISGSTPQPCTPPLRYIYAHAHIAGTGQKYEYRKRYTTIHSRARPHALQ